MRSTGAADGLGREVADVGPVEHLHPLVGAQRPGELAVADVDGDHAGRRRARSSTWVKPPVEAPASRQRRPCDHEVGPVRRARRRACGRRGRPRRRARAVATCSGVAGSTAVETLVAGSPPTRTLPSATRSTACWRERARPRRTSSASRRALRATSLLVVELGETLVQPLLDVVEDLDVLVQRARSRRRAAARARRRRRRRRSARASLAPTARIGCRRYPTPSRPPVGSDGIRTVR